MDTLCGRRRRQQPSMSLPEVSHSVSLNHETFCGRRYCCSTTHPQKASCSNETEWLTSGNVWEVVVVAAAAHRSEHVLEENEMSIVSSDIPCISCPTMLNCILTQTSQVGHVQHIILAVSGYARAGVDHQNLK